MTPPLIPDNEAQRLSALRELLILDTPPEERFDKITRFARTEFELPIALLTLVDQDRQWFKSNQGLDVCETARNVSFCGHAIHEPEIMVVKNALEDERFHDNPLVLGSPGIRFYAGAVLRLPMGAAVGTLCVIDTKPRPWTDVDRSILCALRDLVVEELVRRENST